MYVIWFLFFGSITTAHAEPVRPAAPSVGLGGGFSLPGQFLVFDQSSVRVRLAPGFTLEQALFALGTGYTSNDDPEQKSSGIGARLTARARVAHRGRVDAYVLGGFGVSRDVSVSQLSGGMGGESTTNQLSVLGGLGLEHWLSSHWSLSVDAPMVTLSRISSDPALAEANAYRSRSMSLQTSPQLSMQVHLYL